MSNIATAITAEINKILNRRGLKKAVRSTDDLKEDLNLTSLNLISLVMSICEEQSIDITNIYECQIIQMETVADLTDMLEKAA